MEQVQEAEKLRTLIQKEQGLIVYFYNDDCAPCISLRPKVEHLLKAHFPKMIISWVNSKTNPAIPAEYGVFANPTLLVFFEAKEFRRYSKYVSMDELQSTIERYYPMIFDV